jgi:hypothetical protein
VRGRARHSVGASQTGLACRRHASARPTSHADTPPNIAHLTLLLAYTSHQSFRAAACRRPFALISRNYYAIRVHVILHHACRKSMGERPKLTLSQVAASGRFCCKSRLQRIRPLGFSWEAARYRARPGASYATPTLRDALNRIWWRSRNQRCEPPQVLGDGSQNELILGASRAT